MTGTELVKRFEAIEEENEALKIEIDALKKMSTERDDLILKLMVLVVRMQEPLRGDAIANQIESSNLDTYEILSKANEEMSWDDVTKPKCKGRGGCGGGT